MSAVSEPAYERIAREIRERIVTGALAAGDRAPSGPEITDQWGVAKATANRATALLRSWGLVETVTGVGTIVTAAPPASGPVEHTERVRTGRPIYAEGERSMITEASVLSTDVVSPAVVRAVGLAVPSERGADDVARIVKRARVMYRGDEVVGLCRTWFSYPLLADRGPAGLAVVERLTSSERIPSGTARVVSDLIGVDVSHTTTRAGVRRLAHALAADLAVDPGTPALWLLETRHADDYVVEVDEWYRLDDVVLG